MYITADFDRSLPLTKVRYHMDRPVYSGDNMFVTTPDTNLDGKSYSSNQNALRHRFRLDYKATYNTQWGAYGDTYGYFTDYYVGDPKQTYYTDIPVYAQTEVAPNVFEWTFRETPLYWGGLGNGESEYGDKQCVEVWVDVDFTIAGKLETINQIKDDIRAAILSKGGNLPKETAFKTYANGVRSIPTDILNQDITVTDNGVYRADEGYSGLGTVTVNLNTNKIDVAAAGIKFGYSNALSSMLDFSNCTDFSRMFCYSSIKDLSLVDVSKAKDISYIFNNCTKGIDFRTTADWDTSKVENMRSAFSNVSGDTSDVYQGIGNWNTSNVTNIDSLCYFFYYIYPSLLSELAKWDLSNCTNFASVFYYANRNYKEGVYGVKDWSVLNVWDTKKGTSFSNAFNNNSYIEIAPSWDTSSATSLNNMFATASRLTTVPAYNGSSITSMSNAQLFGTTSSTQPKTVTSFGGLVGTKYGYNVQYMTNLTVESLMNIINGLYDFRDGTSHTTANATMTLGATNLAKLTDEQKTVAIDKGWILN